MWFTPNEIQSLPENSGVYQYFDAQDQVLYIGKAKNLKKRVSSYFLRQTQHSTRIAQMVAQIAKIFIHLTPHENDALILENHLIRQHKPKYNVIFKDDKSYPFLKISAHAAPRLFLFRGKSRDGQVFGPYPDAQAARQSVEILQRIFKLRTCEDSVFSHRQKPCLLYQIKRCSAPCVGFADNYAQDVAHTITFLKGEHQAVFHQLETRMHQHAQNHAFEQAAVLRDQIQALHALFKNQSMDVQKNWDVDIIHFAIEGAHIAIVLGMVRSGRHLGYKSSVHKLELVNLLNATDEPSADFMECLQAYIAQQYFLDDRKRYILLPISQKAWNTMQEKEEMQDFMPNLHYLSHRHLVSKTWLAAAQENAFMLLQRHLSSQKTVDQQIFQLKQHLTRLDLNPHIECFDISHTHGEHTKASCVVFKDKALVRSQFRHFNVLPKVGGDDYEAMYLAVRMRYKAHAADALPHLILIDGGLGQVHAAIQAMQDLNLPIDAIAGIVKGEKRQVGLERLILYDGEVIEFAPQDAALLLLARIRDAAHDFAVHKMRLQRSKTVQKSALDDVAGIGPAKRRRLLTRFGSVAAIRQAGVHELMQVGGISQKLAEDILLVLQA